MPLLPVEQLNDGPASSTSLVGPNKHRDEWNAADPWLGVEDHPSKTLPLDDHSTKTTHETDHQEPHLDVEDHPSKVLPPDTGRHDDNSSVKNRRRVLRSGSHQEGDHGGEKEKVEVQQDSL